MLPRQTRSMAAGGMRPAAHKSQEEDKDVIKLRSGRAVPKPAQRPPVRMTAAAVARAAAVAERRASLDTASRSATKTSIRRDGSVPGAQRPGVTQKSVRPAAGKTNKGAQPVQKKAKRVAEGKAAQTKRGPAPRAVAPVKVNAKPAVRQSATSTRAVQGKVVGSGMATVEAPKMEASPRVVALQRLDAGVPGQRAASPAAVPAETGQALETAVGSSQSSASRACHAAVAATRESKLRGSSPSIVAAHAQSPVTPDTSTQEGEAAMSCTKYLKSQVPTKLEVAGVETRAANIPPTPTTAAGKVRRTSESPPLAKASAGSMDPVQVNTNGLTLQRPASEAVPAFHSESYLGMEQAEEPAQESSEAKTSAVSPTPASCKTPTRRYSRAWDELAPGYSSGAASVSSSERWGVLCKRFGGRSLAGPAWPFPLSSTMTQATGMSRLPKPVYYTPSSVVRPKQLKAFEPARTPLSPLDRHTNSSPATRIPQPWATGTLTPERLLADEATSPAIASPLLTGAGLAELNTSSALKEYINNRSPTTPGAAYARGTLGVLTAESALRMLLGESPPAMGQQGPSTTPARSRLQEPVQGSSKAKTSAGSPTPASCRTPTRRYSRSWDELTPGYSGAASASSTERWGHLCARFGVSSASPAALSYSSNDTQATGLSRIPKPVCHTPSSAVRHKQLKAFEAARTPLSPLDRHTNSSPATRIPQPWATGILTPERLLADESAVRSPTGRPPLASSARGQSPGVPLPLVGRYSPPCFDVVHLVHSMGCAADAADIVAELDYVPGLSVEYIPGGTGLVPCLVVAGLQPLQIVKLLVQLAPQLCGPTEEDLQRAAAQLEQVLDAFSDPAKFCLLDGSKAPGVSCKGQGPGAMRQQGAFSTPPRSRLQVTSPAIPSPLLSDSAPAELDTSSALKEFINNRSPATPGAAYARSTLGVPTAESALRMLLGESPPAMGQQGLSTTPARSRLQATLPAIPSPLLSDSAAAALLLDTPAAPRSPKLAATAASYARSTLSGLTDFSVVSPEDSSGSPGSHQSASLAGTEEAADLRVQAAVARERAQHAEEKAAMLADFQASYTALAAKQQQQLQSAQAALTAEFEQRLLAAQAAISASFEQRLVEAQAQHAAEVADLDMQVAMLQAALRDT